MGSENGVTSAQAWGADNVEVVELPSGEKAKLRKKLNVWTLFRRGKMTPELLAAYEDAEKGELRDLKLAVELNDLILAEMFVAPKVFVPTDEQTELPPDYVHVDQIDDGDVTFVLERAFQGGREVGRFRGDGRGDDGGADGEGVGDDAVAANGAGGGKSPRVPPRPPSSGKAGRKPAGRKSAKKSKSRARV